MRELGFHGVGRLSVQEAPPAAALRAGHVRLEVLAVGICMSDVHGYDGGNSRRAEALAADPAERGLVMGHEAVGRVLELGPGVEGPPVGAVAAIDPIVSCGACEACRAGRENICSRRMVLGCAVAAPGGFAEQIVAPARSLVPLRAGATVDAATLAEPIAVGAHGLALALAQTPGCRSVLVVGGGVVGIGAALAALRAGMDVLMVEPRPARRVLAAELGIRAAAPGAEDGQRFDAIVDCVGTDTTVRAGLRAVPFGGALVLVGIGGEHVALPVDPVVGGERRVIGSYGYTHREFAETAGWATAGKLDLAPLVGGRVGFAGVVGAFERCSAGTIDAVRVVFDPHG